MTRSKTILKDEVLIAFFGPFSGASKKFLLNKCTGCEGDHSLYLKTCKVRPCNIENEFANYSECYK